MIGVEDYAWAGGFLEGEGCFGLEPGKPNVYGIRVTANQRKKAPLVHLQEILGGKIRAGHHGGKVMYTWRIGGAKAGLVIEPLIPYLYGKREEAQALIDYAETVTNTGNIPLDSSVISLRETIVARHAAGRRG